jgi:hypothetical protein
MTPQTWLVRRNLHRLGTARRNFRQTLNADSHRRIDPMRRLM